VALSRVLGELQNPTQRQHARTASPCVTCTAVGRYPLLALSSSFAHMPFTTNRERFGKADRG
jgi:hypothetical protein